MNVIDHRVANSVPRARDCKDDLRPDDLYSPKLAVVGGVKLPEGGGYPIVYVEMNGTVRELTAQEREHVETPFALHDAGRPHVMHKYVRPAWWRLRREWDFARAT